MAITFDSVATTSTGNGSVLTVSLTLGAGSDDHVLLSAAFLSTVRDPVSANRGDGTSLTTLAFTRESNTNQGLWSIAGTGASTTTDFGLRLSGNAAAFQITAISRFGVDQTTPTDSAVTAVGSATPATVDVGSESGDLVVDGVCGFNVTSLTVGAGQTERWNNTAAAGPNTSYHGGSDEAGDTTVTMSWALGADSTWVITGVNLNAAAAGGAAPISPYYSNYYYRSLVA